MENGFIVSREKKTDMLKTILVDMEVDAGGCQSVGLRWRGSRDIEGWRDGRMALVKVRLGQRRVRLFFAERHT
jgi:hypothetical protein